MFVLNFKIIFENFQCQNNIYANKSEISKYQDQMALKRSKVVREKFIREKHDISDINEQNIKCNNLRKCVSHVILI